MRSTRTIMCAVLMAGVLAGVTAKAQPLAIPSDIVQAAQALNADQRAIVGKAVATDLHSLTNAASAAHVIEARSSLIARFRQPGASRIFLLEYSSRISGGIGVALDGKQALLVRLNAMIVVSYLIDNAAIDLVATGLKDPSLAVRYWAAKSALRLTEQLGPEQHARLLAALKPALAAGQSDYVTGQLLLAVIAAAPTEAVDEALAALDARVASRAKNPQLSAAVDTAAMKALFRRIIFQASSLPPATPRAFIRIAYRNLALSARLADPEARTADEVAGLSREDNVAAVLYMDKALREMLKAVNADLANAPAAVDDLVSAGRWADIRALETLPKWKQYLSKPPFNFTDDELAVTPRGE